MAYCRFSSDNHACDVYVYQADEGWVTHVAANRLSVPAIPYLPTRWFGFFGPASHDPLKGFTFSSWYQRLGYTVFARLYLWSVGLHHWSVMHWPRRRIGGHVDGHTFLSHSPGACAGLLVELRASGYRVPPSVIATLRLEQDDLSLAGGAP